MTEKEKMLSGELYLASDSELEMERLRAKKLCFEYNGAFDTNRRNEILTYLLGVDVAEIHIESPFLCDYGYNIKLGGSFFANHHLTILDCAPVTIGDNVMIGPNCVLTTATHPVDAKTRHSLLEFAKPIVLEDGVWLGASVTVCPGVTIGENSVIGAGSVVVKDIPANTVAVGNPCRVVRRVN
ncbi:sugar O-acetyltransferase [Aureibacter tunicatorum]|uniref:Acetyltransferase n=1 Tax=Aureibacter tunicatorum TaxID=866807 RepID=A0AAE4BQG6_9BACT|nr:sugar O-acetyltransferase [Aureibacter tunicatorum]MDR6237536.1 maltose O-acetyltransferase [Aureibacter tunicatorum]BDD02570.1 maltose acetyltransferase [Aureibacter tunicatorum]